MLTPFDKMPASAMNGWFKTLPERAVELICILADTGAPSPSIAVVVRATPIYQNWALEEREK